MTPCQKLLKQEGTELRACNNLPQPLPTSLVFGGCGRLLHALNSVPSCFNSFWHGVIPTSFLMNDFFNSFWHGVMPKS